MDGTRVYTVSQVDALTVGFTELATDPRPDPRLGELRFRSITRRDWWYFDIEARRWAVLRDSAWVHADPPGPLEGPNTLPIRRPPPPPFHYDRPAGPDATTFRVAGAIARTGAAFLNGTFDKFTCTARLLTLGVPTADGLWTTGVWNGSWYRHSGTGWTEQPGPPPEDQLLDHEHLRALPPTNPVSQAIIALAEEPEAPEELSPDFIPPGWSSF